jgi:hypothetical protein
VENIYNVKGRSFTPGHEKGLSTISKKASDVEMKIFCIVWLLVYASKDHLAIIKHMFNISYDYSQHKIVTICTEYTKVTSCNDTNIKNL